MLLTEDFHRKMDRALELSNIIRKDPRPIDHEALELARLVDEMNDELCSDKDHE